MQKVITVNMVARPENSKPFTEYETPILNKYLDEGYVIKNVHQSAPSQNLFATTITFILEK